MTVLVSIFLITVVGLVILLHEDTKNIRLMRMEINRLRSVNYELRDDIEALKDSVDSYPELKEKLEDLGIMF